MSMERILYATDRVKELSPVLGGLLPLRALGLQEIIVLPKAGSPEVSGLSVDGITVKVLAANRLNASCILEAADRERASLIAVDLDRNINTSYGSLYRKLIRTADIPILFMHHSGGEREDGKKGFFSNVIFPTDWSPVSERALQQLLEFKELLGELELVTVISGKLSVRDMRQLRDQIGETRKRLLDNKIDAESHIYAGTVPEEILTAAGDYRASLILLGGESEKKSVVKALRGSATSRVAIYAAMPVLVVP
jgi:nucleotide-binding universal stress UspA family protein